MEVYQISYDLHKTGNRPALFERIVSYGYFAYCLDTVWLIASRQNAQQICDNLRDSLEPHDRLLVTNISRDIAWHNLDASSIEWLTSMIDNEKME